MVSDLLVCVRCVSLCDSRYFSSRGSEDVINMRWKAGKLRLSRSLVAMIICAVAVFVSTGFYIFYNTNVLNEYTNKDEREGLQVDYEKTLKSLSLRPNRALQKLI